MSENGEMKDFDWSPRGYDWYAERKSLARANERQMRFACAYRRHGNASLAAKESGYSGTDETLRQAGHRAVHSAAVVTLLGLMDTEDETLIADAGELKRIFSRAARSGTISDRIRAGEALLKLTALEEKRREANRPRTPQAILREIVKLDRDVANLMARKYWNIDADTYLCGFEDTAAPTAPEAAPQQIALVEDDDVAAPAEASEETAA